MWRPNTASRRLRRAVCLVIAGILVLVGTLGAVAASRADPELPDRSIDSLVFAYVSDRAGQKAVMLHVPDARDSQISRAGMEAFAPSWDPSGCRLAYVSRTREGVFQLRLWDRRGQRPRDRLVAESAGPISDVAWAKNRLVAIRSAQVVGAEQLGDSHTSQEIVRVTMDGHIDTLMSTGDDEGVRYGQITAHPSTFSLVVTVVAADGVTTLETLDSESMSASNAAPLPTGPAMAGSWDHTGGRLAFVRETESGWSLALSEGREPERTIARSERLVYAPSWSPDNRVIIYERYDGTTPDLWAVDTEGLHSQPLVVGPGFDGMPAVAPPCDRNG